MAIQFRRGKESELISENLLVGEPAYCTDTKKLLISDGGGNNDLVITTAQLDAAVNAAVNLALADTGWQTADLTGSLFKPYVDIIDNTPEYRKIGKIVNIKGVVSPVSDIEYGLTNHTIFNLPKEFRPIENLHFVCQGSSLARWLLMVMSDGRVTFSRYGDGVGINVPNTAWLPFGATYFID